MRVLVHDFAGHPFQMQLSKRLAERGYLVVHAYFAGDLGPKGSTISQEFLSGGSVTFHALGPPDGYEKGNLISRLIRDFQYRTHIKRLLSSEEFDVVISGNTPLWIQGRLLSSAQSARAAFVYWCQDFYSIAVAGFLTEKIGALSHPIGWLLLKWDRWLFRRSDHVVHITSQFVKQTEAWGLARDDVSVIPNWGALNEIDLCEKRNHWWRENLRVDHPIVLYSGTLGLKHNPDLILEAAAKTTATFAIVGFGIGYDRLSTVEAQNIQLLPLQSFDDFPYVLGSADVLIAVIEREAGNFSVPSKVLSYLCAGRPIVLAAPADNLASSIIRESGAGLVVEPEDSQGFAEAIGRVLHNPELAKSMGEAGRQYAEENFDIDNVASRFEEVFEKALGRVK